MMGPKARGFIAVFFLMLLTSFLLSSCSMQEISDTFGSCCGVSPLPIGTVGLVLVWRGSKKE